MYGLIRYIFRNPPICTKGNNITKSPPKPHIPVNIEKKTENNALMKEDHMGKGSEEQYRRKLRHKRSAAPTGSCMYLLFYLIV